MRERSRENLRNSVVVAAGWLFADMLLALGVIFIAANTIFFPIPPRLHNNFPTPTLSVPQKTPTVSFALDLLHRETILIHGINYTTLLNNPSQNDYRTLATQIKDAIILQKLQNRRAGLIIVYGVAIDNSSEQIDSASSVSTAVYQAMSMLRVQHFLFARDALLYEPLFTLNRSNDCNDLSCAKIVAFLFTQ